MYIDTFLRHVGKKTILIIAVAVSSAALLFLTALSVILFSIKASKKPHGSNAGMGNNNHNSEC